MLIDKILTYPSLPLALFIAYTARFFFVTPSPVESVVLLLLLVASYSYRFIYTKTQLDKHIEQQEARNKELEASVTLLDAKLKEQTHKLEQMESSLSAFKFSSGVKRTF